MSVFEETYQVRQSPFLGEEEGAVFRDFNENERQKIKRIIVYHRNTIQGLKVTYNNFKEPKLHGSEPSKRQLVKRGNIVLGDDDEIYAVSGITGIRIGTKRRNQVFGISFVIRNKTTGKFTAHDFGNPRSGYMEGPGKSFQYNGPIIGFAGNTAERSNTSKVAYLKRDGTSFVPKKFHKLSSIAFLKCVTTARFSGIKKSKDLDDTAADETDYDSDKIIFEHPKVEKGEESVSGDKETYYLVKTIEGVDKKSVVGELRIDVPFQLSASDGADGAPSGSD